MPQASATDAITVANSGTAKGVGTSGSFTQWSSLAAGQLEVVSLTMGEDDDGDITVSTPTGWSQATSYISSTGSSGIQASAYTFVFYHRATSTDHGHTATFGFSTENVPWVIAQAVIDGACWSTCGNNPFYLEKTSGTTTAFGNADAGTFTNHYGPELILALGAATDVNESSPQIGSCYLDYPIGNGSSAGTAVHDDSGDGVTGLLGTRAFGGVGWAYYAASNNSVGASWHWVCTGTGGAKAAGIFISLGVHT
jgi:hypothetical protein